MSGSRTQPSTSNNRSAGSPTGPSSKQKSNAIQEEPSERVWRALEVRLSKTKLCKYYVEGNCKHGDNCRYAHGQEELSQQPNLQKTKMCTDFLKGSCQKENCSFAHGVSEIKSVSFCYKTTPCMWYAKGKCRNGALCRFVHGDQDQDKEAITSNTSSLPQKVSAPQPQQKAKSEQKEKPQPKTQIDQKMMQPQHVASSLSMSTTPFMANGYPQQWDTSFRLSSHEMEQLDPTLQLDPSSFSFAQSSGVEWNPLDGLPIDLTSPSASPFLGTLMGLQSRLNDISQMHAQMNEQQHGLNMSMNRTAQEPTDPGKVPFDNPRLSEQAINSHEVEMLSQHIQSLTNQVKKLQDFINPVTHKNGHSRSTTSGPSDDSSSNTRSIESRFDATPYRDSSPAAVQNPMAVPGFEHYNLSDSTRHSNMVFANQGLSAGAQDLWWGQPNQDSDEPRYIPTPAH